MGVSLRRSSKGSPGETRCLYLETASPSSSQSTPLMGKDKSRIYPDYPVGGKGKVTEGSGRPPLCHFPSFHASVEDHHYRPKNVSHFGPYYDAYVQQQTRFPVRTHRSCVCGSLCHCPELQLELWSDEKATYPELLYWPPLPSPSPGPAPGLGPLEATSSIGGNSNDFFDQAHGLVEFPSRSGMENLRKFVDDLSPAFKSPESALAKVGNTQRFGRVLATGKRNRGDTVVSGGSSTSFADSELMETSPSTHAKLGGILGDEATIPQSSKPGKSHPYSHWKLSPESSAAYNILSAFSFLPRHAETRCTSQDTPSLSHEVEPTDKGVLVINDDADDAMQSHDPLMAPRVAVHCISDHCENCPTVRLLSDGPECRISDGNRLVEVGTYVVKPGHICTCEEDARKKQQQPRRSSFEPIRLAWRKVSLGIHNSNTKQRSASEDFSPATSLRRPSAFRRTSVERNHSVVNESSTRNTKTKQRSASEDHGAKNASTTRRSGMFFRMSLAFKTKRERSEDDEGVRGIGDANARAEEKK